MSLSDRAAEHLRSVLQAPDLEGTRYTIVEPIGHGGMGTVYLAHDARLQRNVALKVLSLALFSEPACVRMTREAQTLARLEHPAIVPVHDVGTLPDGRVFYAMKFVQGERLDEFLRRDLPWRERIRIFERLCDGVRFAHARKVLHRDLKPQNVMIGEFGEVLVMDWGVAKLLDELGDEAPGTVVGTPGFMAPEQARGEAEGVGPRADVFALGRILEVMLPGPRPRRLQSILGMATAPDAADRYADAGELAADVTRFADGDAVRAHRESPWERAARVLFRYRTPLLVLATYLAVRLLLLLFGA